METTEKSQYQSSRYLYVSFYLRHALDTVTLGIMKELSIVSLPSPSLPNPPPRALTPSFQYQFDTNRSTLQYTPQVIQ